MEIFRSVVNSVNSDQIYLEQIKQSRPTFTTVQWHGANRALTKTLINYIRNALLSEWNVFLNLKMKGFFVSIFMQSARYQNHILYLELQSILSLGKSVKKRLIKIFSPHMSKWLNELTKFYQGFPSRLVCNPEIGANVSGYVFFLCMYCWPIFNLGINSLIFLP